MCAKSTQKSQRTAESDEQCGGNGNPDADGIGRLIFRRIVSNATELIHFCYVYLRVAQMGANVLICLFCSLSLVLF